MDKPSKPASAPGYSAAPLLVSGAVGIYLFCIGLGVLFGGAVEGWARWIGVFPLALGGALLVAAFRWIRIGLSTPTPLPVPVREDPCPGGVELDAKVLAHYEAGALMGSELAKMRQPLMSSWDPLEIELRYRFGEREIVSRRRVSVETFFRTRGMKVLRIKILPDRPEEWAAVV
ncbi:MAG TPA: hypothetical protein VGH73_16335 [Thermoanaerobaculia bacterium]|jgi:hypothetical protein